MTEKEKSLTNRYLCASALFLQLLLTGCSPQMQLYANPPIPFKGPDFPIIHDYPKAVSFYQDKPISPNVVRLSTRKDAPTLYFLNELYKLSGGSFSPANINRTFHDGGYGGCANFRLDPTVLNCHQQQQGISYHDIHPSPERMRRVDTRSICEANMMLKYSDSKVAIEPLAVDFTFDCTPILTSQPQFEEGVPVKMDQPAGVMVFSSPD